MAMACHATVAWCFEGDDFAKGRYSRAHEWRFDGGVTVPASASPSIVPAPLSRTDAVDPEEAFVAAIASCHMLWFLDLARRKGFAVESYTDCAEGKIERVERGRMAVTCVALRPEIAFAGPQPTPEDVAALHGAAHEACFIANSVTTEIAVEPAKAAA
jgi:organic hydroperoxide reductase OsmC/OhrA